MAIGKLGQWVMLTAKPPTAPSPPKLSFHWATPFIERTVLKRQMTFYPYGSHRDKPVVRNIDPDDERVINEMGKYEPNWAGAAGIQFLGEKIRIFPHEYTKDHSMKLFLEEDGALIFHPFDSVKRAVRNYGDEKKRIIDAALLDGCTELQAQMVAEGLDPELGEVPPTGWYEMCEAYASVFCRPFEMAITPKPEAPRPSNEIYNDWKESEELEIEEIIKDHQRVSGRGRRKKK